MTDLLDRFRALLGEAHVLTGPDAARYSHDWMRYYHWSPRAVLRPSDTSEVSEIVKICAETGTPLVPVGGNTGLNGGAEAEGQIMLSLERLNRIREIRPEARVAVVEAGAILSHIHDAAEAHNLIFPLYFGARGSAMIGGALSTNAGGSNVLRFGSTRALCLGLEVVLADGRVLDLMTALHKDNTGYDLRDLFIGAEGTLGIITAAVLKLFPAPKARATALFAPRDVPTALSLLNALQARSGGACEAYELMPDNYMARLAHVRPDLACPFGAPPVTILAELAGADEEALTEALGSVLTEALESGSVTEALLAQNLRERSTFWAMREAAAEICRGMEPTVDTDIALPLDRFSEALTAIETALRALDPGLMPVVVAHLGDGNIHYFAQLTHEGLKAEARRIIEATAVAHGGTFSAEHGLGHSKRPSMAAYKDPVALSVMATLKQALDPQGLLNPGKYLPG